ncbi:MAG: 4-phosphopantoate--beta-alanine ligase, partial [Bacteroidia bacterium]
MIVKNKENLANHLFEWRSKGLKIGFVPTMGALHLGHLSLIEKAKSENDVVVCSIFVNPTQFNDSKDFDKYPRTENADVQLLQNKGCDVIYLPSVEDIYQNETEFKLDLKGLDKVMEGAYRPGHFLGVIRVVKRFFEIVQPTNAYFGLKDF